MRRTGLIVAGCLMSLAFATVAQADTTPLGSTPLFATAESSQTCSAPLIENPFARFGDRRSYVMAPGGSFESTALHGWQLSGSAKRVAEADPVDLGANDGAGMLVWRLTFERTWNEGRRLFGDRYVLVRNEDLRGDPAAALRSVYSALGRDVPGAVAAWAREKVREPEPVYAGDDPRWAAELRHAGIGPELLAGAGYSADLAGTLNR